MCHSVSWALLRQAVAVLRELEKYTLAIDWAARQKEPLPDVPEGLTSRISNILRESDIAFAVREEHDDA